MKKSKYQSQSDVSLKVSNPNIKFQKYFLLDKNQVKKLDEIIKTTIYECEKMKDQAWQCRKGFKEENDMLKTNCKTFKYFLRENKVELSPRLMCLILDSMDSWIKSVDILASRKTVKRMNSMYVQWRLLRELIIELND